MNFLSLIWLIFAPIVISLIILFPKFPNHQVKIRRFAKWFAGMHFIYSLFFLLFFDSARFGMSYEQELTIFGQSWLKTLGIGAKFALDGMTLIFVILTTFVVLIALFLSKMHIRSKHKLYYSMVFLLESAILGIFCAKDMFLFFVFWEIALIPIYFLISQWGNTDTKKIAMKFTLGSFVANMFLFFGMLILYYYNFAVSNVLTANIESLSMDSKLYPLWFQVIVFVNFLIGFASRIPFVGFHNAYVDVQGKVCSPVNILLTGLLMNTGVYGLIRFNIQVFPEIFKFFATTLIVWGVLNIVYAGALSLMQMDIKRLVSYANISAMGFVMMGLGSLTELGFNGALLCSVAISLVFCSLFVIISSIEFRTKNTCIMALGGLGKVMPKCLYFALIVCLAAIGLPFLISFAPKLMVLSGLIMTDIEQPILINFSILVGFVSMIGATGYIMYFFYKVFCSVLLDQWKKVKDLSPQETAILSALTLVIVYLGINPMSIISVYQSVSSIILDVLQV